MKANIGVRNHMSLYVDVMSARLILVRVVMVMDIVKSIPIGCTNITRELLTNF